ncbi:Proline iminopeptidase [Phytophthora fragariae]|uniref:Proline iminopeptidase n=1 Tax=Phytophthora fragariae TaxID=53985 RepID=A0A6G0RAC2_9STRA|nr:Proline iminopeptidase [Phytophthora fragariae]
MLKICSKLSSLRRSGGKTLQLLALPSSKNARPRPVNVPTKNEQQQTRRAALALSVMALTSLAVSYSTSASSEPQKETETVVTEPRYLSSPEEFLYPSLQPFNTGMLRVSPVHELYYEECGNPYGKPVIMVHGGPGAGCSASMRRYHDPRVYRIILLDQRGSGRSKPHASLEDNTTWHLVEDMEKLRCHLGIDKWQVFGGSWGSTLSIAYAITHPTRVTELVLRGIFHLRKQEINFYYQHGSNFLFPDRWEAYRDAIPEEERGDFLMAYHKRLTSDDPKIRIPAALAWTTWEKTTSNLIPPTDAADKSMDEEKFAEAFARIENHYFVNKGFFPTDEFLNENAYKIRHIPTVIVQGRYDVVCPMKTAWDFHKAFPEADFRVVQTAGHSAMEPGIAKELVDATNKFKKLMTLYSGMDKISI